MESRKMYVGITTKTKEARLGKHFAAAKMDSRSFVHQAIRKYGKESFIIEEVAQALSWEEVLKLEIFYIKHMNTYAPNGYNMTKGGEGRLGFKYSAEELTGLSERAKKALNNPATKKRMRDAHLGFKPKPESIEKARPKIKAKAIQRYKDPEFKKRHAEGVKKNWKIRKANIIEYQEYVKKKSDKAREFLKDNPHALERLRLLAPEALKIKNENLKNKKNHG